MTRLRQKYPELLAAAAVMAILGWLDYLTGYQIGLTVLYALPIAWIAWSFNFTWALILALADTVVRLWTDGHWVHHYAHAWIPWERGSMRICILAFIAFSFHQFRRDLDAKNRQVRQLEGILPICIACNRISDGAGHWVDLAAYLATHSRARPENQLCPDCTGHRYR
jgi:hypothetical protein